MYAGGRGSFRLALAGGSIMARCFGSLFGYRFKFRSSPSSCSFHVRNGALRHCRQHRSDDGFALVSLRNDHEIGVASREVKVHKLAAGSLNQLAHNRLSILRCANQRLGIIMSEATTRNQSNHDDPPFLFELIATDTISIDATVFRHHQARLVMTIEMDQSNRR